MPNSTDALIAALQEWIGVSMRRSIRNFILYAKQNNMSMSQVGALFQIHRQHVCSVSGIGDGLGFTSAAASQMLDRLVEQALVERTEDPNDRRAKKIVLTEKGRHVVQQSIHAHQNWFGELARSLPPVEQEEVRAALNLLTEKAKQLDDSGRRVTRNGDALIGEERRDVV
ncbi:MAG: MarR family transcriptional regulator [Anaerolineae bacterium]|nr:MarR family transcriptional regulator [Anaerolineae bacterium]